MTYLGDYPEDQTVRFTYNTRDHLGASVDPTVAGTVWIYKDLATGTEVTTGVTQDDTFDTLTGIQAVTVVTTDAFYATGSDYHAVLKTTTIDGQAINAVVAHWSVENRFTALDEIADAVWDELITGGAHTTNNSAGKRLRLLAESGSYADGAVWIDTVNGTAGTENFENGTEINPVSTIADANTIAASVGLSRFRVLPGSSITFAAAQTDQVFVGDNWTLALGGQSIVGSYFHGATVTGIASGTGTSQTFENCLMGACSHIKGTHFLTSGIAGTQTVAEAGDYFLDRCHSAIAGTSTWVFDFGAAIGNTNLNVRNYSGGIQLEAMGDTGTDTASIEGQGQIIEGTCAGGTVTVRGAFTVSGITNITLTDDARFDMNQITSDASPINVTSGVVDTVTAVTNAVTVGTINADVITASSLAADAADEVAAAVWDEDATGHQTQGTFGQAIGDPVADTTTIYQAVATDAAGDNVSVDVAAVKDETALIVADTNELQGDWANGGRLDLILDAILAMLDDARAEPGQGAPPVNPDMATKLDYLYKWARNKSDNDGSTINHYADDGIQIDQKRTVSESGGTVTREEMITGA